MGIFRKIVFEVGKAVIGIDGDADVDCDSENTDDSCLLDIDDGNLDDEVLEIGDTPDDSNVSFHGRNLGECDKCECKFYTPKPGSSYCICGHSKHSHIGL